MKEQEFCFESFQDGLTLHGTILVPEHPIGILQVVHGMSEHHKRYLPFMRKMCAHGWICVAHDHRGHGESIRNEEDLGYFYDQSGTYVVEDVHQLTYMMKKQFPSLPYVLFGHSMGSLIVRCYCKKYDYELDGLIVCGSPSHNPAALAGQLLASVLAKVKGDHDRNAFIQTLAFGAMSKKYAQEGSENAWVCSNQDVIHAYDADPLCGFVFTLNGFLSLFHLMRNTYDPDDWKLLNPTLPIFFIAGAQDPCIASESKFADAGNFMRQVGYRNVKSKLYPGMRHEILNETKRELVYIDIANFLDACTKQEKKAEKELING